jgi:hypothetical protein
MTTTFCGLKRVNFLLLSLCLALSCSSCHGLFTLHSDWHLAHRIQTPGSASATRTSLKLGLVSCPASSGRLVRLVVALGAIRFACTDRQRASAGPQSRAATPPSLVPRRRTRSQLPSCSAVIASPSASLNSSRESAPEHADRCDCASACCSSAEPGKRLAGRPRCRATQQRASPTAADKRLLLPLPVILFVAKRQHARTADNERE